MPEYLQLREMALGIVGATQEHPCRQGRAECCTTHAPVVPEDENLINAGVALGDIKPGTLEKVFQNVDNPNRTECPFLGEDRSCMIYAHRPITCVFWGVAGYPKKGSTEMEEASERFHAEEESKVSFEAIEPYACTGCVRSISLYPPTPRVLTRAIGVSLVVGKYVQGFNANGLSITRDLARRLKEKINSDQKT